MDSAMYFRACAMVRSGHQDLLIAQLTVRLKYADVKGGGVCVCVCMCDRGGEGGEGCYDCNSALEEND